MAKRKKQTVRSLVMEGLAKLAVGGANDAVKMVLAVQEGDEIAIENLDLFHISEIKKTKDGFELKLFDRQKALEALMKLEEPDKTEGMAQIVKALSLSAEEWKAEEAQHGN